MIEQAARTSLVGSGERLSLKQLLQHLERDLILRALSVSDGNQRRAAIALGVLPTTLSEKLRRLNIHPSLNRGPTRAGRRNGRGASTAVLSENDGLRPHQRRPKEKAVLRPGSARVSF